MYKYILSLIFFILAIIVSYNRYLNSVKAVVLKSKCRRTDFRYKCNIIILYVVNSIEYVNHIEDIYQKDKIRKGDYITIFYNTVNPKSIQYGYLQFVLSFILFIMSALIFFYGDDCLILWKNIYSFINVQ